MGAVTSMSATPTFETPEPISATVDLLAGDIRINASDRTDTVVDVRPSNAASDADVQAASQVRVEYSLGELLVKAPKNVARSLFGRGGSVDVAIDLPTGSRIDASTAGDVHTLGRLGESKFKTASGRVRVDKTGSLRVSSADGDIAVTKATGHADVSTANGEIRIGEIDGSAAVKTANGDISLGEVSGDLRLNTANGDISVRRALGNVDAKTAYGSVRISEVVRGSVVLKTAAGELEVGVREGSAAWLDVSSMSGNVDVALNSTSGPSESADTVEIRARTYAGDIVIRRS